MPVQLSKKALPAARQRLVELIQRLSFGQVVGLRLRGGQPLFDPPPRIVRDLKLAGEEPPRAVRPADDFVLKAQVVELLEVFDRIGDGVVDMVEVKHGLPFRVLFAEPPA